MRSSESTLPRARGTTVIAVFCALGLLAVPVLEAGPEASAEVGNPGLLTIRGDGLLYTYNLLTDTEALFDLERDPRRLRNLRRERPREAMELRLLLSERLGVDDLPDLRDPEDREHQALRGLGYL